MSPDLFSYLSFARVMVVCGCQLPVTGDWLLYKGQRYIFEFNRRILYTFQPTVVALCSLACSHNVHLV